MTTPGATKTADFLYDAIFSSALGAMVVALVLLGLDLVRGEPFHTPSVLGAALFTDVPAGEVTGARLDLVAYATLAHFVAFTVLGFGASALVVNVKTFRERPYLIVLLLFLLMEGGIRLISVLFAPDLVPLVGPGRILIANAIAALAMGGFLAFAHRDESGRIPQGA